MEGEGLVVLLSDTTTSALTEGVGRGRELYGTVYKPWYGQSSGGRLYGGRGLGRSPRHHITSDCGEGLGTGESSGTYMEEVGLVVLLP